MKTPILDCITDALTASIRRLDSLETRLPPGLELRQCRAESTALKHLLAAAIREGHKLEKDESLDGAI